MTCLGSHRPWEELRPCNPLLNLIPIKREGCKPLGFPAQAVIPACLAELISFSNCTQLFHHHSLFIYQVFNFPSFHHLFAPAFHFLRGEGNANQQMNVMGNTVQPCYRQLLLQSALSRTNWSSRAQYTSLGVLTQRPDFLSMACQERTMAKVCFCLVCHCQG